MLPEKAKRMVQLLAFQNNLQYELVCDYERISLDRAGLLKTKVSDFVPHAIFSSVTGVFEM